MKKVFALMVGLLLLSFSPAIVKAQDDDESTLKEITSGIKKGAKKAGKGVKRGAQEVAEQASELKSDLTDKEVENKTGPKGDEDIFLDNDGRYYYKDYKGRRVYLKASQLRDRPAKKYDDD